MANRAKNSPIFGENPNQNKRNVPPVIFGPEVLARDYDKKRAAFPDLNPNDFQKGNGEGRNPCVAAVIPINFALAQAITEIEVEGSIVDFADSTNNTDVVNVAYHSKDGKVVPFRPGKSIDGIRFSKIAISWSQIIGAVGTLVIYRDYPESPIRLT
jgi:hypothetical protein